MEGGSPATVVVVSSARRSQSAGLCLSRQAFAAVRRSLLRCGARLHRCPSRLQKNHLEFISFGCPKP